MSQTCSKSVSIKNLYLSPSGKLSLQKVIYLRHDFFSSEKQLSFFPMLDEKFFMVVDTQQRIYRGAQLNHLHAFIRSIKLSIYSSLHVYNTYALHNGTAGPASAMLPPAFAAVFFSCQDQIFLNKKNKNPSAVGF